MDSRNFPSFTNTLGKAIVFGSLPFLAFAGWLAYGVTHRVTNPVGRPVSQPVPFSHARHVGAVGIDCRYCHDSVEHSPFAGMPPTETCMHCHSHIGSTAPILQPVRMSYRSGRPLHWKRVYDLPEYVFFDHSIHVKKGIGCVSCHGRVDQMVPLQEKFPMDPDIPVIWQAKPMTMDWCLECHRSPEKFVRPLEQVYDMVELAVDENTSGKQLVQDYRIKDARNLTACSTCHF